ncbi:hypothetical protein M8756_20675, partial [Lutimaribacter sp. EGI FJ00015]|nr:hypothetical protein [Lutimaribacter sp. EGI FJ00015]
APAFLKKMKTNFTKNLIQLFFCCIYELVHVVVGLQHLHVFVSVNFEINLKNRLYNEHYPSILVTFLGRPSILVGKMEH